ncbi:MAG: hypothetical protein JWO22_2796, partial [Frankiales bacterium]|nr:hypothetical protein [Frankiales bacterium]
NAVVGGEWGGRMVLPNGASMRWAGEFREVDPTRHLVLAFRLPDEGPVDGSPEAFELFTWDLVETVGITQMTLTQSGGHLSEEQYGQAKAGTGSFLDVLEEHLGTLS